MSSQTIRYRPRGEFVVFRLVDLGHLRGIAIPGISAQAKDRIVVACGPEVKDLEPGDSILIIGEVGQDVAPLPNEQDLYVTKQSNIILVVEPVLEEVV